MCRPYEYIKWIDLALCLCAFNIMYFFWGKSGIEKYLFRYIPISLSLLFIMLSFYENKMKFCFTGVDILWTMFFLYVFVRTDYNSVADFGAILIYIYALIILIFAKADINHLALPFKIIFVTGMVYSITVLLQLICPNQIIYIACRYSSFVTDASGLLRTTTQHAYMAGIVGSVAYAAGYFANNVAILLLKKWEYNITTFMMWLTLLISLGALILTGKRAHFLFMIISLCIVSVIISKNKTLQIFKILLSMLILCSLIWIGLQVFPDWGIFSRINTTFDAISRSSDVTSGRLAIFHAATSQFMTAPILGIGFRNFYYWYNGVPLSSHNFYLQVLCELGIVGFVLLLTAQITTLLRTYKKLKISLRYDIWKQGLTSYLAFSLYFQIFFALYGLTESIFYYQGYTLLYFLICNIPNSYNKKILNSPAKFINEGK